MADTVSRIRSLFTFLMAIIYLSNLFIKSNLITDLNLILMVVVIGLSFTVVSGTSLIIGSVSFALSIFLLLYYHAPLSIWEQALQENLYLVVMFTLVPLLGIPIQFGGYFEALQGVFRRYVYTNSRFYLFVSFISAFIGVLVNLAVVPLVLQISQASPISTNKKLLSSAISRGFATCTIWAPTTAAIALIIQLTGAKWPNFFPFGILCGIIAGFVGYFMTMSEEKRASKAEEATSAIDSGSEAPVVDFNLPKVIELTIFSIILISSIAIVSLTTGIHTVVVVSIASIIYPILWLGIIRREPVWLREFKGDYFHVCLPKLKNEIILFMGAGLFATSINYSHLGNYVSKIISLFVGPNPLLLAIVIIIISLILSALGVHPIITVTIIGGTLKASAYGITPTYLAVILAISWAMGISISPSSATVIAISGLTGQSPLHVGPYWNGVYVLISSVAILVVISMFRLIGLL